MASRAAHAAFAVAALLLPGTGGTDEAEPQFRHALPAFPLRTSGRFIVDSNQQRVRLACVNWYGAHLKQMAANGLNHRSAGEIANIIAESGFNCVRLPFSLDTLLGNFSTVPRPQVSLAASPDLWDSSPLQVFDATLQALTDRGIMVVLNNHVSSGGWCCSDFDHEGLWYTEQYPESMWLDAVGFMAGRYRNNSLVIGFDMRNEIRPAGGVWPAWASGDVLTDWSQAAVKGAERVLAANGDLLIVISGVYYSLFLCEVPARPVHSEVPWLRGRVVYTAHEYRWFNFHLTTRKGIEIWLLVLGIWCGLLWLLVIASLLLRRYSGRQIAVLLPLLRLVQRLRCTTCCRSSRRPGASRCWEVPAAALLTAACAVSLKLAPSYINACNLRGMVEGIACVVLTPIFAFVSLVLWMRAALIGTASQLQRLEEPELVDAEVPMGLPQSSSRTVAEGIQLTTRTEVGPSRQEDGSWIRRTSSSILLLQAKWLRHLRVIIAVVVSVAFAALLFVWHDFGRYEAFASELDFKWGFLLSPAGGTVEAAPVWLGEFGSSENSLWWQHMLRYLADKEVDFAYWSINGEKYTGVPEMFGLYMEDFVTVQHQWKLDGLQDVMNKTQLHQWPAVHS